MTHSTNNTMTKQFFDLHTNGIGYVNRIREVEVKKGKPYLSCTIAALRGNSDEPEYTYFDCNVTGEKAKALIARCQDASKADKKILITFCIGDVYADTFVYSKGEKQDQTGVTLKARLLKVSSLKIDGEVKYSEKEERDRLATEANENAPSNDESQVNVA